MLNVTCEINGKKIDISDSSAIDQAILQGVIGKATDVVKAKLTEEEQNKITITVKGDSLDDLSLNVSGPEEVIAKLKSALKIE
jgi:hypothetical protein